MNALALPRLLTRRRRRKPRPPMWWLCVAMLFVFTGLVALDASEGAWLSLGSAAGNGVVWWRALHSPPRYWDPRAFWRWWPPAMALAVGGLFWP